MSKEITAFAGNRSFDLVPRQPHFNIVECQWLFTNKFLPSGIHNRCKAHLVDKGYNQQYGQDYTDTFSLVIKATTIRLVRDIAVSNDWPIQRLDVNSVFLQGTLIEEVYMEQPPGFVDADNPDHICCLNKAIYGLKQVPWTWYTEFSNFLLSLGFKNLLADTFLFVLQNGNQFFYILVYVGNSKQGIQPDSLPTR